VIVSYAMAVSSSLSMHVSSHQSIDPLANCTLFHVRDPADNPRSFLNRKVTPIHAQKNLAAQLRSSERVLAVLDTCDDKLSA